MGVMQISRKIRFAKRLRAEWKRAMANAEGRWSTLYGALLAVLSAFAYMEPGSLVKLLEGFGLNGEWALAAGGVITGLILALGVRGRKADDD